MLPSLSNAAAIAINGWTRSSRTGVVALPWENPIVNETVNSTVAAPMNRIRDRPSSIGRRIQGKARTVTRD